MSFLAAALPADIQRHYPSYECLMRERQGGVTSWSALPSTASDKDAGSNDQSPPVSVPVLDVRRPGVYGRSPRGPLVTGLPSGARAGRQAAGRGRKHLKNTTAYILVLFRQTSLVGETVKLQSPCPEPPGPDYPTHFYL
ncbi:hypothetical protein Bbelb_439950 [Branchiostoma belcheri]|nr:hypothetical protein Bbelb_439950 [Branchiostoma belcheri]